MHQKNLACDRWLSVWVVWQRTNTLRGASRASRTYIKLGVVGKLQGFKATKTLSFNRGANDNEFVENLQAALKELSLGSIIVLVSCVPSFVLIEVLSLHFSDVRANIASCRNVLQSCNRSIWIWWLLGRLRDLDRLLELGGILIGMRRNDHGALGHWAKTVRREHLVCFGWHCE